ncbi:MAG: flagellar hook basal-body protein, partial [Pseudomonadota bacterium]|nr:flagellar hook basal-body protein [Pseudomonadota bacterium]
MSGLLPREFPATPLTQGSGQVEIRAEPPGANGNSAKATMPIRLAGNFCRGSSALKPAKSVTSSLARFLLFKCATKFGACEKMSLFGAINTAVSGLTAQSKAFGNISEDVSNSQTVGFKRVDTNFVDYLTTSTATNNEPDAVVAQPDYVNNIQGSITQTDNPLGMAIAGQGFFAVSQPTGSVNGVPTYNPQQFYTRAGDFSMNASGYLVNGAG